MSYSWSARRVLLAISCALLALSAGLLTQFPAYAAPAAPSGLTPNAAAVSTNNPTLSWNRVPNAAKYEVQVDDNDGFASPLKATTSNRRWVPTTALANGTQYFRVRAIGTDSSSSGWTNADFTIDPQVGPTPVSPSDGATLEQPDNPPLLSWTAVSGATGYTIEVSRDQSFLEEFTNTYTTKTTSIVVPDQDHGGTYYWHVRAVLGTGITSLPSADSSYVIGDLEEVTNANPDSVDTPYEDVVLDWDPVPGAASYNLWVSTDPDFNDTSATVLPNTTVVKGTRYSPPITFLNNQYYWKVRAINAQGETIDWNLVERHIFQRDWVDAPELQYPADSLTPVGDSFYYQWTPVDHATYYQLQVDDDPGFNSPATCSTAATTYTAGYDGAPTDACMPNQGATLYWRVRAMDAPKGVQGIYSASRKFIYDTGASTLLAPANGASVAVPTLKWAASREAEKYHVEVTGTGGGSMQADTYSTSWTPSLDPTKSPFTWTVQAQDANGKLSPKYSGRSFSIAGDPADTPAAQLTPLTGIITDPATRRFPSLTWEPSDNPAFDHYKLNIGVHDSGFWDVGTDSVLSESFDYPAATSRDDYYLKAGQYDWQVEAYDEDDNLIGAGPLGTFTIADLAAVTGQRVALTGQSLDSFDACTATLADVVGTGQCDNVPATPVIDWQPVPDAAFYKVYISQDRNLTNLVYGSTTSNVPRTVNTRWTPTMSNSPALLPDSQAGKAYYWYIQPCKSDGVCNPNPISVVNVAGHAFSKVSPKPVLQAPTTASSQANDVAFSWQDYLATNQATTWAPSGEQSHQAGKQYHLQVSTQNDFSALVDDITVDQTTYTPYSKTYPEGALYWRVQGVDAANNELAWSNTGSFTKSSPVPTLVSPINDLVTGGMTAFRWDTTPFAATYKIEVYKNNDATFSSANRIFSVTTKQTAYAYGSPLPASPNRYLWRVLRTDGGGKPGNWSATGAFYSTGVAPTLLLPAASGKVVGNDSYFTWSAVPGAAKYQIEIKQSTQTTGTKTTTPATAFAPLTTLADGSWQWRVSALDANNVLMGTSAFRGFIIDGTRPTVIKTTPAANAKDVKPSTNFVASFSEPVTNVTTGTVKLYKKGSSNPVTAKVTLSATKRSVTLNPTKNLTKGKVYTIKLSSSIKDLNGLQLVAKSWKVTIRN